MEYVVNSQRTCSNLIIQCFEKEYDIDNVKFVVLLPLVTLTLFMPSAFCFCQQSCYWSIPVYGNDQLVGESQRATSVTEFIRSAWKAAPLSYRPIA
jgi:hypothetical protein